MANYGHYSVPLRTPRPGQVSGSSQPAQEKINW